MFRPFFLAVILAAACLAAPIESVSAQPTGIAPSKIARESKSYTETLAVLRNLAIQFDAPKDVRAGMDVPGALKLIEEKLKAVADTPLTIVFDYDSLSKDADAKEIIDGNTPPVRPRSLPARVSVKMVLDHIVRQTPGATYIIRQGRIDVVNVRDATAKHLMTQPVLAVFDQRPLHEVLNDLSDLTGLSINLDANIGDKVNMPISAVFRNNVTLEDALINVTEMAGLKFVVLKQSIYVGTPASAAALEKEQKAQPGPKNAKLKELLKERLAVAREIAKLSTEAYKAGTGSYDEVREATRMVLQAELEQCDSDKDRIAVLEKFVAEAEKMEEHADQLGKTGRASMRTLLKAKADRLQAKIALEQTHITLKNAKK